jgi:hypothetical protein
MNSALPAGLGARASKIPSQVLQLPHNSKRRPSVEVVKARLEDRIADEERNLRKLGKESVELEGKLTGLGEKKVAAEARLARRKDALTRAEGILIVSTGLEAAFGHLPAERRLERMTATMEAAEKAFWDEHTDRCSEHSR